MRFTVILILLAQSFTAMAIAPAIPLDTVNNSLKWQLMPSEYAPEDAKTLELFHGRQRQWVVARVESGAKSGAGSSVTGFYERETEKKSSEKYAVISEITPYGADEDPSRRIYNLPELTDRLQAEGKLPPGVEVMAESQGALSIIVKKPVIFAATYSLGRKVRIINRSSLIVMVMLPEHLEVFQQKPEGSHQEVKTKIYSAKCIPVQAADDTKLERFTIDGYYLGSASDSRNCENDPHTRFKGGLQPWMPQILVSARVRGESIAQMLHYWKHFINPGI